MKSYILTAAAVSFLTLSAPAHAQQSVQWTQILNLPKGYNMPKGMKAEILGLEIGDTYAVAKARIEQLRAEGLPPARSAQEVKRGFFLPSGSGPRIEASYIGLINVERKTPGEGPRQVSDDLQVYFTAPSSGHQAYKIVRSINYWEQANQPRISEFVAALKSKFGNQARFFPRPQSAQLIFQYNNGSPVVTNDAFVSTCPNGIPANANEIKNINPKGQCDIYLLVTFSLGISSDHAAKVHFELTDQQRAKENLTADYTFFDGYAKKVQEQTRGAPTKL